MSAREGLIGAVVGGCLAVAGCSGDVATADAGADSAVNVFSDAATVDLPATVDVVEAFDARPALRDVVVIPDAPSTDGTDATKVGEDGPSLDAPDTSFDARNEAPDTSFDAGTDARSDAPDAPLDARSDAPDAPLDARSDAPDAPFDARSDARLDAPADAATGPRVDRTSPQLYTLTFRANDADPAARLALGNETAFLDTRVAPRNVLVVYLHGAGAPTTCGSNEHERLLSSWGFHVLGPCYVSDYGVGNCGADIAGCRLEAFDGVDRHPFVNITPPDAIETRVVRALTLLQQRNPAGDWQWFLDGGRPRWSSIIISGISHGASSSGLIAEVRPVVRAVMLSGPLDTGQAWLTRVGLTPAASYWGLTHMADPQHSGHVAAFASLRLPGALTNLDTTPPTFDGSHRLTSAARTTDGHGSTQAGGVSPRDAMGRYLFEPAWRLMYGATP